MTREEAIYQLELCKSIIHKGGQDWLDERDMAMLDMAIEALDALSDDNIQKMQELEQAQLEKAYELGKEEAQQWIPCSERLPDDSEEYLVTVRCDGFNMVDIDQCFSYGWDDYGKDVIAWMEFPKPYMEDDK